VVQEVHKDAVGQSAGKMRHANQHMRSRV
jgi:hypothetical protein